MDVLTAPLKYSVEQESVSDGAEDFVLATGSGKIRCRMHRATEGNAGVVYVFGAGGGLGGPACGIYERLARTLQPEGITSLQVDYRRPGDLRLCVEDVLTGVALVESVGVQRTVLVGHSFGGAVVIQAGVASPAVVAVAALSSQTRGGEVVDRLSPKALLLMHGEADEVLPPACSVSLYRAAKEPKELRLYPGCKHGLDQCREEIDRDLTEWLLRVFRLG
jgi:alpha/beta superfamily hydrolase